MSYNINNKKLIAILKNGIEGIVINFDCKNDYINILLKDDSYAKSVPIKDILIIYNSEFKDKMSDKKVTKLRCLEELPEELMNTISKNFDKIFNDDSEDYEI